MLLSTIHFSGHMNPSRPHHHYYDLILAACVVVLLCSNFIGAGKAVVVTLPYFGELVFGGGILFFPIAYFLATSLRRSTDMPMTAERYGQDLLPSWRKLSLRYPLRQVLIWPIISMDWRRYLETLGALHWHPCFHFGEVVLRIVLYWPR